MDIDTPQRCAAGQQGCGPAVAAQAGMGAAQLAAADNGTETRSPGCAGEADVGDGGGVVEQIYTDDVVIAGEGMPGLVQGRQQAEQSAELIKGSKTVEVELKQFRAEAGPEAASTWVVWHPSHVGGANRPGADPLAICRSARRMADVQRHVLARPFRHGSPSSWLGLSELVSDRGRRRPFRFGGYKQSGVGREHGPRQIDQCIELESVCIPTPRA